MCYLSAIFTILLFGYNASAETSTVCKCDGKKCGEVKILSNLVPLAVRFAGLRQGSCSSQGYTEKTGEILKVKTPIGTIESPVYVKAVGEVKKRLGRMRKARNPLFSNKYIKRVNSMKNRQLYEAQRPNDCIYGTPSRHMRRRPIRRTKTVFTTYSF